MSTPIIALPQDEVCLHLYDGRCPGRAFWGAAASPKTCWHLRQSLTPAAQSSATPGRCSAASSSLSQQSCISVPPRPPNVPIGRLITSQPTPLPDGLCGGIVTGAFPTDAKTGLHGHGRPTPTLFLPSWSRLTIHLSDQEELSALWFRGARIG